MNFNEYEILVLDTFTKNRCEESHGFPINVLLAAFDKYGPKKLRFALESLEEKGYILIKNNWTSITKMGYDSTIATMQDPNEKKNTIEENRLARIDFLKKAYENVNGNINLAVDSWIIGDSLSFKRSLTSSLVQYLVEKGYLIRASSQGMVRITSYGIDYLENGEIESKPKQSDLHTMNITNISNNLTGATITDSQVQMGQNLNITIQNDIKHLKDFLKTLKSSLSELDLNSDTAQKLSEEIESTEALLTVTKPKKNFLKESFVTIRNILEGGVGSALAQEFVTKIPALLEIVEKLPL